MYLAYTINMRNAKTNQTNFFMEATMAKTFELSIPSGTKVLCDNGTPVTLLANVSVSGATREFDGGYVYSVDGRRYYVSAGTLSA